MLHSPVESVLYSTTFLLEVCILLHQNNISILIDTNGTIDPTKLETLSTYVDGFMFDVKAFSNSRHQTLTGQNNENILLNFDNLARLHKLYEIRTVIVPDIVDNKETIDHVCSILKKNMLVIVVIKSLSIGIMGLENPIISHIEHHQTKKWKSLRHEY